MNELNKEKFEKFEIVDGKLIGYTGQDKELIIPKGVKVIGDNVFSDCDSLVEVVIPEGIESLTILTHYRVILASGQNTTFKLFETDDGTRLCKRAEAFTEFIDNDCS